MRTVGIGVGGRRSGEPEVARARGELSLSGVACAVRRELALLGAEPRSGTGVSALDIAGLENARARCLDWMEQRKRHPAMDRQ